MNIFITFPFGIAYKVMSRSSNILHTRDFSYKLKTVKSFVDQSNNFDVVFSPASEA